MKNIMYIESIALIMVAAATFFFEVNMDLIMNLIIIAIILKSVLFIGYIIEKRPKKQNHWKYYLVSSSFFFLLICLKLIIDFWLSETAVPY